MDPGLRFWLRYVEHGGGLADPTGDGTLVMLPEPLADDFDLPAELVVTSREAGFRLVAAVVAIWSVNASRTPSETVATATVWSLSVWPPLRPPFPNLPVSASWGSPCWR